MRREGSALAGTVAASLQTNVYVMEVRGTSWSQARSSLPGLICRPECATASVWVCVWEKRISAPPSDVLRA
jgi:hypothetical protein